MHCENKYGLEITVKLLPFLSQPYRVEILSWVEIIGQQWSSHGFSHCDKIYGVIKLFLTREFYESRNKGYNVGAKVKQANRRHITAEGHKKTIKCWRIRGLLSFHDIIRVVPTTFLLYFFYIVASSFFIYNRVFLCV